MDLKFFAVLVLTCAGCSSLLVQEEYSGNHETPEHWRNEAKSELDRARNIRSNMAVAKNVILFLGDGMGVSTVTAARILKGQLQGQPGEEGLLSFETFPHVGLSKTYNQDAQTADSAGTATAYYSGVKTNLGLIGVDARGIRGNCSSMVNGSELNSILDWSLAAGKAVGLVTTTRVTHATPAALYAHTPERDWESDVDVKDHVGGCRDIAVQLVDDNTDIQVILGGGREKFMKNGTTDPQSGLLSKGRNDNRDLTQVWQENQQNIGRKYKYVWNNTDFQSVDPKQTDYLLGLFNKDHMKFEIERDKDEPSLAEMTEKAIQILQKNTKGFFLLVEGGRIDHAHHYAQAVRSLHDTLAFADAVQKGVDMTKESDTLIIVTADHSHTFTIGGYPTRGNPIFGLTDDRKGQNQMGNDKKPFTTLNYANGPGGYATVNATLRPDLSNVNTSDKDYRQQSAVPLTSETHGGEDVAIYAQGPMSHLFHGVHEQHYIAHVMAFASCVGQYSSLDSCAAADVQKVSAANTDLVASIGLFVSIIVSRFLLL